MKPKPHLQLLVALQQAPGSLGGVVVGELDGLGQPPVGLGQAGAALLQLLQGLSLQLGQILQGVWALRSCRFHLPQCS